MSFKPLASFRHSEPLERSEGRVKAVRPEKPYREVPPPHPHPNSPDKTKSCSLCSPLPAAFPQTFRLRGGDGGLRGARGPGWQRPGAGRAHLGLERVARSPCAAPGTSRPRDAAERIQNVHPESPASKPSPPLPRGDRPRSRAGGRVPQGKRHECRGVMGKGQALWDTTRKGIVTGGQGRL